jgi:hypothetical protein
LTVEDAHRIAEALEASHAESTRLLYAHVWRVWERWCAHRGIPALPADPAALAAYLVERATEGTAVVSLNMACTAIRYVQRQYGLPNRPRPSSSPGPPRLTPHLRRRPAIILLGFASAVRGSELVQLRLADVPSSSPACS